jgi:hypothetical protein
MASTDWRHRLARPVTEPVVRFLARTPLTPNAITLLGFGGVIAASWLIITSHLFWAGIVVLLASILDAFDGALARLTGRVSLFGSILDSTFIVASHSYSIERGGKYNRGLARRGGVDIFLPGKLYTCPCGRRRIGADRWLVYSHRTYCRTSAGNADRVYFSSPGNNSRPEFVDCISAIVSCLAQG